MKRLLLALPAAALVAAAMLAPAPDGQPARAQTGTPPAFSDGDAVTYTLASGASGASTAISIGSPAFSASTVSGASHSCAISTAKDNASNDPARFKTTGTNRTGFAVAVSGTTCVLTYTGTGVTNVDKTLDAVSIALTVSDGRNAAGNAADTSADDTLNVTVKLTGGPTADHEALDAFYDSLGGASWSPAVNWRSSDTSATVWSATAKTFNLTAGVNSGRTGYSNPGLFPPYAAIGTLRSGTSQDLSPGGVNQNFRALWRNTNGSLQWWDNGAQRPRSIYDGKAIRIGGSSGTIFAFSTASTTTNADIGRGFSWPTSPANIIPASGNWSFEFGTAGAVVTQGAMVTTGSGAWTGITFTGGRVSAISLPDRKVLGLIANVGPALAPLAGTLKTLDLSTTKDWAAGGNRLSGGAANLASLGVLTGLTSLDLSGHNESLAASLGIGTPAGDPLPAGLRTITALTFLDLRDTGICINPGTQPAEEAWLNAIRGRTGGQALIATCGSPSAPAFAVTATDTTGELEAGASGAVTPIRVGRFDFSESDYSGAVEACSIVSAIDNPAAAPASFLTTGTARTGFTAAIGSRTVTVAGTPPTTRTQRSCDITYTGTGIASSATLRAISIVVGLGDGVNAEGGADATADATVRLTVEVSGLGTDEAALHALFNGAGGSSWTAGASGTGSWREVPVLHTWELTAGANPSGNARGWRASGSGASPYGSVRNSSSAFTLNGRSYTTDRLYQVTAGTVVLGIRGSTIVDSDFRSGMFRIGTEQRSLPAGLTLSGTRLFQVAFPANTIASSGNFDAELLGSLQLAELETSSTWHGVTITNERVSALNLSNNNLSGAVPAALGNMVELTSLDLSDNSGLTATTTVLRALAAGLTNLTSLDLSGTGICVDPGNAQHAPVVTWIGNIRAKNTNTGVAKVPTCGAPVAPAIADAAVTYELASGADGSSTAIAIGAPTFTAGDPFIGGATVCAIASARGVGSNDPADFSTTGGTDLSASFAVTLTGSTCAITYTGAASVSAARDQTLEAVSLAVTVSDGVDPEAGTISAAADDTINVTVKFIEGEPTDRDALDVLYAGTDGASWTDRTGWREGVFHTIGLTAGSGTVSGSLGSGAGYQDPGLGSGAIGSVRNGRDVTVGGVSTRINRVVQLANGNVVFTDNQGLRPNSDWNGLSLRLGTTTLAFTSATTSGGLNRHWTWTGQATGLIPSSGNFDAVLLRSNPPISSSWHGVTVSGTPSRLTALDLGGNGLSGALAESFADLSALTSLDLSGNAGLTATPAVLEALAAGITGLTSLDLSGTGICADPTDADQASVEGWITAIRGTGSGTGVAKVATCGSPAAPSFSAESARAGLEAGAVGTGTPIAIATPTFAQGTYVGGRTATCSIVTAKQNASYDPADFTTTGTDVAGFSIDGATCALTYTGAGLSSSAAQLAVSISVGISDGVDPEAGTRDTSADDTIKVTVKLVGLATDREALLALYGSAGGSGWTTSTGGWTGEVLHHTIQLTAGSGTVTSTLGTGNGYQRVGTGSGAIGSLRGGQDVTVGGVGPYQVNRVVQLANGDVVFTENQGGQPASRWANLRLRLGTTTLAFTDATTTTDSYRHWTWAGQAAGLIPSSGDFDALIMRADPALASTWHGATVSGTPTRLTALALPNNNLSGTLPDLLADLSALTSLDLSGNTGLTGTIPTVIGSLAALTSLDLSDGGWSGAIPVELGSLTSLTTLDLGGNALTGEVPAELGSLTALTSLDLGGNALTGEAPAALGLLTALTTLDLSGNRFTDVHDDLGALTALTTLDLSDNNLAADAAVDFADVATPLSSMAALTSLDLSGNANLTGSIPASLLTLGALESLDLSGTGVCVNPATETAVETWLAAIRARNSGAGVAKVATCGSPAAPSFTAESLRGSLEAGANGSSTPIAVGTPTFTQGGYSGGTAATCTIVTAKENASYDPADFTTTGTDVTGFVIDGPTCAITYEGTGLSSTAARLAVSLSIGISDGVDPSAGTLDASADDTIQVTVKLVGLATDRVALLALYGSAGGSGWTTSTGGWTTVGATLSSAWHGATASGTPTRLTALALPNNNLSGTLPGLLTDLSALASLDLSGNAGLTGSIPATLGSLVALTSLDLSDSGWTGSVPVALGSLTALTTLDLGGNALTGAIPSQLGLLTALTTLDLSGNAALGGDLAHLTGLTSLTTLDLTGTGLCVNPAADTAVESWLNALRGNGASVGVHTCGSPNAPALAAAAATYLLDVGADGSSTAVAVGTPAFTGGTYSGGSDACTFSAIQNPSGDPGSFLGTGTAVTGFAVDSSNCAITWTGSSAPTRVAGARVAVSIGLEVTDGVNATGGVDATVDDTMQVTVRLVDLASDKLAIEALHDDTNGASWGTRTGWKTSTLTGSWHGVTLTSGRLTALALPDNGLSGQLPALMGDLSRLTSLDLSGNSGLTGGIPAGFARLRNVASVDLRGTRVCQQNLGAAANAWLNGIRASGGAVYLGSCPSSAPPGGTAGIVVVEEGRASGLRYSLQLTCGASSFAISLGAGERYAASVSSDAACSLTATDRQGALAVRGEFSGRSLGGDDIVVTFVREAEEDEEDEMEVDREAVEELERTLVAGTTYALWRAAETPVADAVGELELCVVAVYWWDPRNQRWESWFPGAEGLGVNTLDALAEDGIYVFTAERRTPANCGPLPDDATDGDAEDAAG